MSPLQDAAPKFLPREEEVRARVRQALDALLPDVAGSSDAVGSAAGARPVDAGARLAPRPDAPRDADPPDTAGVSADIAIGADHGGVALKAELLAHLRKKGFRVHDCGSHGGEAVDYPDYAARVARLVAGGRCATGIMIDGAGIGSCMAANKLPGIRAALCYDISSARNSREHNHANLLTLGAGLIGPGLARQIVDAFLETEWGGGRHARRVAGIMALEDASGPRGQRA